MAWQAIISGTFLLLPFGVLVIGLSLRWSSAANWCTWGGLTCLGSAILLAPLLWSVFYFDTEHVLRLPFMPSYGVWWELVFNRKNLVLLFVINLAFLISYIVASLDRRFSIPVVALLLVFQGSVSLFVICTNILLQAVVQIWCAIAFFFLLKEMLRIGDKPRESSNRTAETLITLQMFSAVGMAVWSVITSIRTGTEGFLLKSMTEGISSGGLILENSLHLLLFGSVFVGLPALPFKKWYEDIVGEKEISSVLFVPMSAFVGAHLNRMSNLATAILPDVAVKYSPWIVGFGCLMFGVTAGMLYFVRTRGGQVVGLILLLVASCFFSLGFASDETYSSIYLVATMAPIFGVFGLFLIDNKPDQTFIKAVMICIFAVILGAPGSPVFHLFALMGGNALMGDGVYGAAFALVWLLYFMSAGKCCRVVFFTTAWNKEITVNQAPESDVRGIWWEQCRSAVLLVIVTLVCAVLVANLVSIIVGG